MLMTDRPGKGDAEKRIVVRFEVLTSASEAVFRRPLKKGRHARFSVPGSRFSVPGSRFSAGIRSSEP
jgi:hypothetical protein